MPATPSTSATWPSRPRAAARDATPLGTASVTLAGGITYDSHSFYIAPVVTRIRATRSPLAITNTTLGTSFPGFQGETSHAELNGGAGACDASIAFAGIDLPTAQAFTFSTCTVGGSS